MISGVTVIRPKLHYRIVQGPRPRFWWLYRLHDAGMEFVYWWLLVAVISGLLP